jgi:hypothetical protein
MRHDDVDHDDARQKPRPAALKAAVIEVDGAVTMRCLLANLSDEGAELTLAGDQRVPARFVLHVPALEKAFRADVRWRSDGRVGVMFTGAAKRPRTPLTAV